MIAGINKDVETKKVPMYFIATATNKDCIIVINKIIFSLFLYFILAIS
jgi:hypothetical protein